jgi:aspartyl-tRNA(Asn)/glutamyl-tRNA(Gln) amidotransferase subunit C
MSLDVAAVTKIAKLSRIKITETEKQKITEDLNGIFEWIEQLQEVNTDGIEPMAGVGDYTLRQREDVVNDGNIQEKILGNATDHNFGCFSVPKVID